MISREKANDSKRMEEAFFVPLLQALPCGEAGNEPVTLCECKAKEVLLKGNSIRPFCRMYELKKEDENV